MKKGEAFYLSDLDGDVEKARHYTFYNKWGIPVRYHDYQQLLPLSNPGLLEFHLSYKDLDLNHDDFFPEKVHTELVVHAPELFSGDHILDLASPDDVYRTHSISEMHRVIATAKALRDHFTSDQKCVGIITNVGGFSMDGPLSPTERVERLCFLRESLQEIQDIGVEIWPQTMPPFPWHFGGQRYHNLFLEPEWIVEFCTETGMRVCLDISHTKLACNHLNLSFQKALEKILPFAAHLHIADARGVDGEGLQIGEGEIDFYTVATSVHRFAQYATWIPEVWQGHENNGELCWKALNTLEKYINGR
jgi:N-acetylneuraminate synthase